VKYPILPYKSIMCHVLIAIHAYRLLAHTSQSDRVRYYTPYYDVIIKTPMRVFIFLATLQLLKFLFLNSFFWSLTYLSILVLPLVSTPAISLVCAIRRYHLEIVCVLSKSHHVNHGLLSRLISLRDRTYQIKRAK
jgi:predicted cation transporter